MLSKIDAKDGLFDCDVSVQKNRAVLTAKLCVQKLKRHPWKRIKKIIKQVAEMDRNKLL